VGKIPNSNGFQGYIHTLLQQQTRTLAWVNEQSAPYAKVHVYQCNVSSLEGKKSIFGPSKGNTGMLPCKQACL